MKKLSVVVVGRNDGYGDTELSPYNAKTPDSFVFRMRRTIESNVKDLTKYFDIDEIQYVVVDWSPVDEQYLHVCDDLKDILSETYVKNIIVKPETIENKGWNPKNFYEYYAKNVGIRNSDGEYVLITNPDIVLTEDVCFEIYEATHSEDKKCYYRPYSRIDVDNQLNYLNEGLSFPKTGLEIDEVMGSPAAGDFLLMTNDNFINIAKGYDETISTGYNTRQTNMDANIIVNAYKFGGMKPVCFDSSIKHLDHAKEGVLVGGINTNGYVSSKGDIRF